MSKKDFIALADAFISVKPEKGERLHQFLLDTEAVSLRLKASNPRFMRDRWMRYIAGECGPNGGAK